MKRAAVVVFVAATASFVGACVPDRPDRLESSASESCAVAAERLAEALGRRGSAVVGAGPSSRVVRIPVGELGDWVILGPGSGRMPAVTLIREGRVVTPSSLSADCTAPLEDPAGVHPDPPITASPPVLTDAELRATVAEQPAGVVVYVWAPHMPLSVDGYLEIAAATESLGLSLVPVLFRSADRAFARREAERVGMPNHALREVGAAELVLRDAQLHAPSVLLFHGGRTSPVLPGYRDAGGYRSWLEAMTAR